MHIVDHVHESDCRPHDSRVSSQVPLVDEETEWSAVAQVVSFEVGHDESEPRVFIVEGGAESKKKI